MKSPSFWRACTLGIGTAFAAVQNAIEHRLRELIKWRRGVPCFQNESKEGLFVHLSATEQEEADRAAEHLYRDFHLQHLHENSSAKNYRINLFYLEMLSRALSEAGAELPESVSAADIGPSDWFYVHALHALLKWWDDSHGRDVRLTAYEADAYRICSDLFSRYDLAHGHMSGLEGVQYIPEKFSRQPGRFDVVAMLFPFVFV